MSKNDRFDTHPIVSLEKAEKHGYEPMNSYRAYYKFGGDRIITTYSWDELLANNLVGNPGVRLFKRFVKKGYPELWVETGAK